MPSSEAYNYVFVDPTYHCCDLYSICLARDVFKSWAHIPCFQPHPLSGWLTTRTVIAYEVELTSHLQPFAFAVGTLKLLGSHTRASGTGIAQTYE